MNMRKRLERLEARHAPADPRLDAMFWRVLATFGADEREQQVLLDHAAAVEAGLAHGNPPETVGAMKGILVGPR
jgi:hypothetical protein